MRIVVSNTSPVVALCHAGCLKHLPSVFEAVYLPKEEIDEWVDVLSRHGYAEELLSVDRWKSTNFIVLRDLTAPQKRRALQLSEELHPGEGAGKIVDGASIVLARTLQDTGVVDGLWADEGRLRELARREGVEQIHGSLWFFVRALELRLISLEEALAAPRKASERGYRYSDRLLRSFRDHLGS